jgi:transposase
MLQDKLISQKAMNSISSLETERHRFLYVGMDIHKDNHAAVATNCFGQNLLKMEVRNSKRDFDDFVAMVERLSKQNNLVPLFGLEDSCGYGHRLASYLYKNGYFVKTIPPILVDKARKRETHPEKTDSLDALQVARVLIQRIDRLPNYSLSEEDEISKQIKELTLDREFLVKEQTRIKNQLHRLLHKSWNSEYKEKFKNSFSLKALRYWKTNPLPRKTSDIVGDPLILKNQIKRKVKRLLSIRDEVRETENEIAILMKQTNQKIETLNGCGLVLGSKLIAEIKNIKRFRNSNSLAKYAGLCPREKSSGKTRKHIKTKSGNRKLNMVIHRIALSQISKSGNERAKEYFQKKLKEGKTKAQALCCLKRRLIDIIFMMLKYKQEYNYQT